MPAFLASIGVRDYIYAGLIAALIGGFAYYTHHERVIGADEALAPVAVLAHKAEVQVAVAAAVATITEKDNAQAYTAAVSRPAPAALGIVCSNPGRSPVSEADTIVAPGVGDLTADVPSSADYDPSGATLKLGATVDAQVTYLQGRIRELESQMESAP